jgi:molybdopterin synthase sulfur carrier subunit
MNIVYCGRVAEIAGTREEEVAPPPAFRTVATLRAWLGRDRPDLLAALCAPSVRAVVNDEVAEAGRALAAGDEIAFLPPVSGG